MASSRAPVAVGEIIKPHGIDGEVIVSPLTDFPEYRFAPGETIQLEDDETEMLLEIQEARPHKDRLIVDFKRFDNINQVEELRQKTLSVPPDQVFHEQGSYYRFDLIGMEVFDEQEQPRGTVSDVYQAGGQCVLVVEFDGDTLELPSPPDQILDIDLDGQFIQLQFPDTWEKLITNGDSSSSNSQPKE